MTYKLVPPVAVITTPFSCVRRISDGAFIPFSLDNADCRQFLLDWQNGMAVQRPNGNPFTYTAAHRAELGL